MFNSIRPAGRIPVSLLALAIVFASLGVAQTSESLRRATPGVRRIESGDVLTRATDLNNALLRLHGEMQSAAPDGAADLRRQAATAIEQRAAVLSDLIQQDPRQALSLAFSAELHSDLAAKFPEAASKLERHGTLEGPAVAWVEDHRDGSSLSYVKLRADGRDIQVHFDGATPHLKCGDRLRVTGVQVGTVFAAATTSATTTATSTTSSTTLACSTTGTQNAAVLLVTFPGTTLPDSVTSQYMNGLFFGTTGASLNGYWQEASYGQTSAAGSVFGPYTLGGSYSCSAINQFISDAMSAAAASGVNFQTYNRVSIVFPGMSPSCGWAGLSSVGCYSVGTTSGTFTVSTSVLLASDLTPNYGNFGLGLIEHENGHQLGLAHARLRQYGTDPLGPLGTTGTLTEYGDHFAAMGYPNLGHYSASHKAEILGWLAPSSNYQVVQSSGTYTLQPYETSPLGLDALKIQRGTGNNAWLWVEYRQPSGAYDSTLPTQPFSGALIHYEDSVTGPQTDLLDFTAPATYTDNPGLTAGQTWVDPYSNVSITVQSATATGMTLSVTYGSTPCTHANPTVSISPANPSVNAGSSVSYTVSVTNNDSSGCSASAFSLTSTQPSGWTDTFSATFLTLNPGQTASTTLTENAPASATAGTYSISGSAANGSHSGSGSANATVMTAQTAPTLTDTTAVGLPSYSTRQTVTATATVTYGNTAAAGATVTFTVTKPNGGTATGKATADSTGKAAWSYKLGPKDPTGTYSVVSNATYQSMTASSQPATFTVQ